MTTLSEQLASDALDAQKFTRKYFVLELDFSENSVQELDAQFDAARYAMRGGLTPENIEQLRKLWGAYLGEVLRRKAGGEWLLESIDGEERIVLQGKSISVSPHERVVARIKEGPSQSIWKFFQDTKSQL